MIDKNPDVDSLYFKRGCQLMREDKHKEAIGDFDKVLSLAEGRTKKEVIKVDDLEFSKELNEQLDKAFSDIFSNKTRSKVLNNRGMCKLKMKDVNGAWSDFMGAIMADSLNTNAMNGLGLLSWRIRDYEMAKSSLDNALRLGDSTLIDLSIKINKKLK